jgi:(2Fe-2S) ferredoxin/2-polyprenyl-3-methyl-5-hydroxy-6-metoxy-1,4-benzoquinol methylase
MIMEPFRYHVFICDQQKPEGASCCAARGSAGVIDALRREIASQGLLDVVQVTTCGSLGLCEHGPNMVVYPEGVWYCGLTPADVPELVRSQFRDGVVLERLERTETSDLRAEIIANREKHNAAMRANDAAGVLPDELSLIIRSFQESRVILTAVELDLFSAVGPGSGAAEVAWRLGTDPRATEMLLNALAAMGLLAKEKGVFRNTPLSSRFLAAGGKDDSRAAIMHTVGLWTRWSTLTDCVRAGTAVAHVEMDQRGEQWTEAFIAAMDRNARERAPHVTRAVGSEWIERMLDVGGGSGAYSIAFARANPRLKAEMLDLPPVCLIAQRHIDEAGLTSRVTTRSADLRRDSLGEGYDLILVSAICHMLSQDENLDLLRRCHAALRAGGRVVVQDFVLEDDKAAPKSAALFSLNMLVGTVAGSSYSVGEYTAWLGQAGFEEVIHLRLPGPSGLMIGTRRTSGAASK